MTMTFDPLKAIQRALHVGHHTPPAAVPVVAAANAALHAQTAHLSPALPVVEQGVRDLLDRGLRAAGVDAPGTEVADLTADLVLQSMAHFVEVERAKLAPIPAALVG